MTTEQNSSSLGFMGMEPQHKLVTRLVGLGTAIAIVTLLLVGVSWLGLTRQALREGLQRRHEALTQRIAAQVSALLESVWTDLAFWIETQDPAAALAGETSADLHLLLAHNTQLDGLILLARDGREIARISRHHTFTPSELGERSQTTEFLQALKGERVIGPVYQSEFSARPVTTFWMPVRAGGSGEVVGVLAVEVNFSQILADLDSVELGEDEIAYLVDDAGRLIGGTGIAEEQQRQNLNRLPIVDDFLNRRPMSGEFVGLAGEQARGTWATLAESGWGAIVETPSRRAMADLDQFALIFYGALMGAVLLATVAMDLFARRLVRPLVRLQEGAIAIGRGDLDYTIQAQTGDEIESLAAQFNQMAQDLKVSRAEIEAYAQELEQQVAERTQALARRTTQLETAAQVSEAVGSILDPRELNRQVVELIRQRFDYYYVGLFLVDDAGEFAVLRAGTGRAGRQMLAGGHKLAVGGASMIGWCVANARPRIALDVGREAVRFVNPLLPETRSEMALPLISRGQVVGAITVQSEREAAFSAKDISVLQTVAGQVATAIQNASLFEQTRVALQETEMLLQTTRDIMTSASLEAIYRVLVNRCALPGVDLIEVLTLDPRSDPPQLEVKTTWNSQAGDAPVGHRVALRHFPGSDTLYSQAYVINDIAGDQRATNSMRQARQRTGRQAFALIGIRAQDRLLGVINVQSKTPSIFTDHLIHRLEALASQTAIVLENRQLLDQAQRRATQLQTAADVSRVATSILDVDELLTTSVNLIRARFGLYYVGLFLVDDAAEFAVLRAGTGEAGRQMLAEGHKLAVGGASMIGWCAANKQARITLDVSDDLVHFANPLLPDTRSEMALPLLSRGQVIGAMTIQSTEKSAFYKEDISVLQTMAEQIANSIANARLFEAEQRRRRAATALQKASLALSGVLEPEQVYQETLKQLAFIAPYDSAAIFVYDLATRVARPVAARGVSPAVLEEMLHGTTFNLFVDADPLFLEIIGTGQSIILRDAQADERFFKVEGTEYIRGWMGVPMVAGDRIIGLLTLDSRQVGAFDKDVSSRVIVFAAQAALAMENARLFQETRASLQEITLLHQRYLREQWDKFLAEPETRPCLGYIFDQHKVWPVDDLQRPEIDLAVVRGRTLALTAEDKEWAASDGARSALVVPLDLRGQIIGALDFFEPERDRTWTEDDVALVEAVAAQVALAVENARAYEELQRTAVQLREMDTLKSQFLANMSHELRTPLNSIIGFSRVMLKGIDGPLTDLQRTDLTSIYNNGQHLLGLINDVLDLSRIEAGKMELVFEPVDIGPVIDGVMSTALGLVKDQPVQLVKEVAENLPVVRADSTRIRQVILNLISNAAKFTEEGSITVRAWAEDDCISISVTDTGTGVPEGYRGKIFEEFEQVDGSATRRTGGTGLGLPISRHFVELHGGSIWVESEMGVGSTFTFTIPIYGPGYIQDPELAALEIDPHRRLVLAIEDSKDVVGFYRRYLERHGYQVISLADGDRALPWARELSPFAVLLDVMLVNTDGWAVLEKLKKSRETANVPVIICSIADEEARGLSLGAAAYLTRPVLEDDLLQAMSLVAKL